MNDEVNNRYRQLDFVNKKRRSFHGVHIVNYYDKNAQKISHQKIKSIQVVRIIQSPVKF